MAQCPVFVICRDRVEALTKLVAWLERAGQERIVLIDNDSAYEPLLEYYQRTPHDVIRIGANFGHHAPWTTGLVRAIARTQRFVVTDPDVVPDDQCPLDAIDRFGDLLDRFPDVTKVGFGLRIDDLPDGYEHNERVQRWERQFWSDAVAPGVYRARIDTTFALYREGSGPGMDAALRTGTPLVARHLGWYDDTRSPSEELKFYRRRAHPAIATWSGARLPPWLEAMTRAS